MDEWNGIDLTLHEDTPLSGVEIESAASFCEEMSDYADAEWKSHILRRIAVTLRVF